MTTSVASEALDAVLDRLQSRKHDWVRVGLAERVSYLRRAARGVHGRADDWLARACAAQGVATDSAIGGELMISGPFVTVRGLRLLANALEHGGAPPLPAPHPVPGGRRAVRVVPGSLYDTMLYPGIRADIWLPPGRELTQGRIYREKAAGTMRPGRVCLVLGAGNIHSIAPLDVVHKLFVEDEVVVLKLNPVTAWLEPVLAGAFADLIADGFLAILSGGGDVGARLVHDERVETLHITGSDKTYDAIVWGVDPAERERRKREHDPLVSKPFTAELGAVSPVLVVPGEWSAADIRRQARSVAGAVFHNASFNCNAPKVLVLSRSWRLKADFLAAFRRELATLPARPAYYPGAEERWHAFVDRYPNAEVLGPRAPGSVPWTLIPDVPARPGEYALSEESFCGVLSWTEIDADGPERFLDDASTFANHAIHGTLSCMVLIDPKTRRRARAAYEAAIADLRYGNVCVNVWPGFSFAIGNVPWGAFPGHTPEAIGSGVGVVHNMYLVDDPEKCVVLGAWRLPLKPIWNQDFRTIVRVGRGLLDFEIAPSPWKLPALAVAALRA